MRASKYINATLRENPQDAVIASHRLMLRSGLARKQSAGHYHWMPLGFRVLRKIENIVREEMDASGALEFQLPILTTAEVWEKSGRWNIMGKELFRIQDRHDVWHVLGPTHEEAFTDLLLGVLKSYRDLPVNVYQIHTKFRDEIRPRYGLIRCREFVMKDAYSFDLDEEGLEKTYQLMRKTYRRIFSRTGLDTIPVEADSGSMGGTGSEEFMVSSEVGEETLLVSEGGRYRGNQEKTAVIYPELKSAKPSGGAKKKTGKKPAGSLERLPSPDCATIEAVEKYLKVDKKNILKTMLYYADGKPVAVCMRSDRNLHEIKLKNHLKALEVVPADPAQIRSLGTVPGYIGPEGLDPSVQILWDNSILTGNPWVIGANEKDLHLGGYVAEPETTEDFALAVGGDPSPAGDGLLKEVKGIEVGHIFKLGKKYTSAFEMTVLDVNGKPVTPIMGCYGIGVSRTMAAVIEQDHDESGIVWPISIAPFEICLVSITKTPEEEKKAAELYAALSAAGMEVIWDDRDLRPGVKFADADLIGYPIRLTLGKGYFENGEVELLERRGKKMRKISGTVSEMVETVRQVRQSLFDELAERMKLDGEG